MYTRRPCQLADLLLKLQLMPVKNNRHVKLPFGKFPNLTQTVMLIMRFWNKIHSNLPKSISLYVDCGVYLEFYKTK